MEDDISSEPNNLELQKLLENLSKLDEDHKLYVIKTFLKHKDLNNRIGDAQLLRILQENKIETFLNNFDINASYLFASLLDNHRTTYEQYKFAAIETFLKSPTNQVTVDELFIIIEKSGIVTKPYKTTIIETFLNNPTNQITTHGLFTIKGLKIFKEILSNNSDPDILFGQWLENSKYKIDLEFLRTEILPVIKDEQEKSNIISITAKKWIEQNHPDLKTVNKNLEKFGDFSQFVILSNWIKKNQNHQLEFKDFKETLILIQSQCYRHYHILEWLEHGKNPNQQILVSEILPLIDNHKEIIEAWCKKNPNGPNDLELKKIIESNKIAQFNAIEPNYQNAKKEYNKKNENADNIILETYCNKFSVGFGDKATRVFKQSPKLNLDNQKNILISFDGTGVTTKSILNKLKDDVNITAITDSQSLKEENWTIFNCVTGKYTIMRDADKLKPFMKEYYQIMKNDLMECDKIHFEGQSHGGLKELLFLSVIIDNIKETEGENKSEEFFNKIGSISIYNSPINFKPSSLTDKWNKVLTFCFGYCFVSNLSMEDLLPNFLEQCKKFNHYPHIITSFNEQDKIINGPISNEFFEKQLRNYKGTKKNIFNQEDDGDINHAPRSRKELVNFLKDRKSGQQTLEENKNKIIKILPENDIKETDAIIPKSNPSISNPENVLKKMQSNDKYILKQN